MIDLQTLIGKQVDVEVSLEEREISTNDKQKRGTKPSSSCSVSPLKANANISYS